MPNLYLASQSLRRAQILRRMNVPFRVVRSAYREKRLGRNRPELVAIRHACGKALQAIVPKGARLIVGADTVVWCRGRIFGKPLSHQAAHQMLFTLSGRVHRVYTGVVLWDRAEKRLRIGAAESRVKIKRLSPKLIKEYLARINPFDKAGSYAIQLGPKIVERIEGSYTNVMGLPRELVRAMLKDWCRETS
ncbi:MAG: septum formation protein Maf [Omnitrophica bacterium RIFCSPLOWO2_01_FULL_50_24]|nr:MAG: septum formation protein Maf [Omnitrophica bacterium RIFCSPLOWO2_01_FULL_50_24]